MSDLESLDTLWVLAGPPRREGARGGRGGGREGRLEAPVTAQRLGSPRREVWGHKPAAGLLQDVRSKAEGRRGDLSWGMRCRGWTDLRRVCTHGGPLRLGVVEGVDATRRCGLGYRYSGCGGSTEVWRRRAVHCCNRKACTGRGAGSVGRVCGWIRGRAESEGQGLFWRGARGKKGGGLLGFEARSKGQCQKRRCGGHAEYSSPLVA